MDGSWFKAMLEEQKEQEPGHRNLRQFPCTVLSPSSPAPTSVHQLRPSDINVVAGIGDSFTEEEEEAGVRSTCSLITEAIPIDILREYNDDLIGAAEGVGNCNDYFDMSQIAQYSSDFVDQADRLVEDLQNDPDVDFENDWKVITVLLGVLDLCNFCLYPEITPDSYIANMRAGLDVLFNNIPRAFVNLVQVLPVIYTQTLQTGRFVSDLVLGSFCTCAAFPETAEVNMTLLNYTVEFQQGILDIAASGDYDSDNFTVVVQRFFENFTLPYE
ncbi:phospholipase B1, membrane-associated, partial [Elysia marginata]